MKKYLFIAILLAASCITSVQAQVPSDTAALRAKILSDIVTNGSKSITAKMLQDILVGVSNLMNRYSLDSAYLSNDTIYLTGPGITSISIKLPSGAGGSETDPTVPSAVKAITSSDISNWNSKQSALTGSATIDIVANIVTAKNSVAQWNADKIQGRSVSSTAPATGQLLGWNGTTWIPVDPTAGGGGVTDLAYTPGATSGTVTSSTGTDAIIPTSDGSNAGLLHPDLYHVIVDSAVTSVGKVNDTITGYYNHQGAALFYDTIHTYNAGFGFLQDGHYFIADTARSTGLPSYYYTDSISNARNLWQINGSNNLVPKTFSGSYLDLYSISKQLKALRIYTNGAADDGHGSAFVNNGSMTTGYIYSKSSYGVENLFRISKDNGLRPELAVDFNNNFVSGFYTTKFLMQALEDSSLNIQSYDAKRMRIDAFAGDLILKATPITKSVFLNVATDTLLEAGFGYLNLPKLGGYGNVLVGANDTGRTKRIYIGANLSLSGDTLSATGGGGGGSGTVSNSASANRLAYYSVSGTTVTALAAITGNRALISDANGLPTASSVTNTELGYVSGVTSSIQTQLNGKASSSHTHVASNITDFNSAARLSISLTTTGNSGAANYNNSTGEWNIPQYLSAADRNFFDSAKNGQIADSIEVTLVDNQDVYLKKKAYGSSTWDSAFQFTIPNTSAWDSVIRTTLTTTSTVGDFSNATLSRIVNVPNGATGTIRFQASCNDGSGHFFSSLLTTNYYKSTGGTLTLSGAASEDGPLNGGLPSETSITVVNSGDNLAFMVTTGTVTAVATGYWKLNICLTSNSGASF